MPYRRKTPRTQSAGRSQWRCWRREPSLNGASLLFFFANTRPAGALGTGLVAASAVVWIDGGVGALAVAKSCTWLAHEAAGTAAASWQSVRRSRARVAAGTAMGKIGLEVDALAATAGTLAHTIDHAHAGRAHLARAAAMTASSAVLKARARIDAVARARKVAVRAL
jgi:hypothetical protein